VSFDGKLFRMMPNSFVIQNSKAYVAEQKKTIEQRLPKGG
jgi:hypothetical protein